MPVFKKVQVTADGLDALSKRLGKMFKNLKEPLRKCKLIMYDGVRRNFSTHGTRLSEVGVTRWAPLSTMTFAMRKYRESIDGKSRDYTQESKLIELGTLLFAVTGEGRGGYSLTTERTVTIGTKLFYAPLVHDGFFATITVRSGERNSRGRYTGSVKRIKRWVPGRPYMVLNKQDNDRMKKAVRDWVKVQLEKVKT